MTKSVQLQKFGVALTAAMCFFAYVAFASAQEATIDTITEGDMPTISGTATDVETVDLSITQDDTEVYAEMDIAVASGTWSHTLDEDLDDGDYVAVVSASSTELATSSFTVDTSEEEEEEEGEEEEGDEEISRSDRLSAMIARLQALLERLLEIRERTGGKAVGPVKNPHLNDDYSSNNSGKNTKVCHNGKTMSVGAVNLQAHLGHGDVEGECGEASSSESDSDELEIEVELHDGQTHVHVKYPDDSDEEDESFFVDVDIADQDAVIAEIASVTGLSVEEIEEVVEFESDDDDDDDEEEDDHDDHDDDDDDDEEDDD